MPLNDIQQRLELGDVQHLALNNGDRLQSRHGVDHYLKQGDVEKCHLVENDGLEAQGNVRDSTAYQPLLVPATYSGDRHDAQRSNRCLKSST